jgi:pimeloyl-ACP methyl ester carboxylesterase
MSRMILICLIVLALAALATFWRAGQRAAAALQDYPPTGSFIEVAGTRLHYRQMGQGPDVILVHGASGNIRDFDFGLMEALSKTHRVAAFDHPGHGHSAPIADASLSAQAGLLKAAVAELGITQYVLVGQSYGGAVALNWSLEGGPAALVLISAPSLPWPGPLDPWYRVTNTAIGRTLAPALVAAWVPQSYIEGSILKAFAPDLPPEGYAAGIGIGLILRASSLRANADQVNALRPQLVEMEQRYSTLTLPIELIHGDADTVVPLTIHSQPLSLLLPNAHLSVVPGLGHMPHHAALPEVLQAIEAASARAGLC